VQDKDQGYYDGLIQSCTRAFDWFQSTLDDLERLKRPVTEKNVLQSDQKKNEN